MNDKNTENEALIGGSGLNARLGATLHDDTIHLKGLCETLCSVSLETIGQECFNQAQDLSWSYKCLARLANELADKLSDAAPYVEVSRPR